MPKFSDILPDMWPEVGTFVFYPQSMYIARERFRLNIREQLRSAEMDLPPGIPEWITRELVENTIWVWSPYFNRIITVQEAVSFAALGGELMEALYKN